MPRLDRPGSLAVHTHGNGPLGVVVNKLSGRFRTVHFSLLGYHEVLEPGQNQDVVEAAAALRD